MMAGRRLAAHIPVLVGIFALGSPMVASADVVNLYNFGVTLNGSPVFTDTFSTGTLDGGSGSVLPAGPKFSDGSTALYQVIGTLTEAGTPQTGTKAVLDTAQGALVTQSSPGFFPAIRINAITAADGRVGSVRFDTDQ